MEYKKLKILMIYPLMEELFNSVSYPPLGLLYLAGNLIEHKYDVSLFNMNYDREDIPVSDVYLFSCNTAFYFKVKKLMERVRNINPKAIIILGGVHPTLFPEKMLQETEANIVVEGEGEFLLVDIINDLNENTHKCKKHYMANRIYNLDSISFPARDLVPINILRDTSTIHLEKYSENGYATTLLTSRGCPYNCAFCCKVEFMQGVRYRSPDNILKEIIEIENKYDIHQFRIVDDFFAVDRPRIKYLMEEIKKNNLNVFFNTILRADSVDLELLDIMYKMGVRNISIGVESGDPEILIKIKKRESIEDIEKCIKWCKQIGITVKVFLIFGLPGETLESIKKTKEFMVRNKPDSYTLSNFTPLPGSAIWNNPEEFGIEIKKEVKETLEDHWFYFEPDDTIGFHINISEELKRARGQLIKYLRSGDWKR